MIYMRSQISLKHGYLLLYKFLYNSILTIIWVFIHTYVHIFCVHTILLILIQGYTYFSMSNLL